VKLTDYIAGFLADSGVTKVFGLTGGAAVHLLDSVCRHPRLEAVFMHHEQAVAFAAQASARQRNDVSAAIVTTGPGGTNAITGLTAAWLDSVPCLYFSGQVRLAHARSADWSRQVGTQHLDIISVVKPITKHAVMLTEAKRIRYELEKALWIARSGRPGPVWLDIPLDLQWADVDPQSMESFVPPEGLRTSIVPAEADLQTCVKLLKESRRPLLLLGYGAKLSGAEQLARDFINRTGIPFITTWNAADMIASSHPLNVGRPGIFGQRGANLAMQNCDLLLAVGSHLCLSVTGTQTNSFARDAKRIVVNIDQTQLERTTVRVDHPIHADASQFFSGLNKLVDGAQGSQEWKDRCAIYREQHSWTNAPSPASGEPVNPYSLMERISAALPAETLIVIDGGGTVNQVAFQAFRTKEGQRLMISSGLCSMGSGLPESVGACVQSGRLKTLCLCGDGSLQLNIQELQTIVHHQLPICIFVLCNSGYNSIRQTQDSFLDGRRFGSEATGGMSLPDYAAVGKAYGLSVRQIDCQNDLEAGVNSALEAKGPVLCLVRVSPDFKPEPRQGFAQNPDGTFAARPLEDMYPFLPREEFNRLMCLNS